MELRGRDLLSAEARFLADYCGEDAVRRWHVRLSDAERGELVSTVAFVREPCRGLAGAVRRMFQTVLDAMSAFVRSIFGTWVAAYASIIGRAPDSFGHQSTR
jgi:hypothetical protein